MTGPMLHTAFLTNFYILWPCTDLPTLATHPIASVIQNRFLSSFTHPNTSNGTCHNTTSHNQTRQASAISP